MAIGAYIIGDEILSGKRQDRHFARLREILAARGLRLSWVSYLPDDRQRLVEAFRRSFASGDIVISCGGIGVTPDDHTRQAAATALGVDLALHPEAEREIRARFDAMKREVTAASLELGTYPAGASIVPNPYNRIPGFSVGDHHFLPGFPEMAWPMSEWVLDTYYAHLFHAEDRAEENLIVWEGLEGQLLGLMRGIEADFPGVKVTSLPSFGNATTRRHIELGLSGPTDGVAAALKVVTAELDRRGEEWIPAQKKA